MATEAQKPFNIPELGQHVKARQRRWSVKEISTPSKNARETGNPPYTLVTLEGLNDDALGEELTVVWELEPGTEILSTIELPEMKNFDSNASLEAFLNAARWGAIANAERKSASAILQAPFRSGGLQIEPYQLDPLVRALMMTHVNLLIADDVGLGKTIEAGLVVQELILRSRARSVLVVCPASLQQKWKDEMTDKFGLDFRIVNSEYLRKLRRTRGLSVNPWTSYPRLIASMDWIKQGDGLRLLNEVLPTEPKYPRPFDVLVVDEAHNVAPAGNASSAKVDDSKRTEIVRRLAPHFMHKLFLSATPHNGYPNSFAALLELLDDQRFSRVIHPSERALQQVMVRRLKSDIKREDGTPVFKERILERLEVGYTEEERKMARILSEFTKELVKSARDEDASDANKTVKWKEQSAEKIAAFFIGKILKKRFFSSPSAFYNTLAAYKENLDHPERRAEEKRAKRDKKDRKLLTAYIALTENPAYDDQGTVEEERQEADADAFALSEKSAPEPSTEQKERLKTLLRWAEDARHNQSSKDDALVKWINDHLRLDGKWNDERVVIFTEYRDSYVQIFDVLAKNGLASDYLNGEKVERVLRIDGSTPLDVRETIKAQFQASPKKTPARILLATDAASEGIDLQNYCRYMIHYEIPWNPNVMEQRIGRIDRHGQRFNPQIWHPAGNFKEGGRGDDLDGDLEYLFKIAQKVNVMRQDLGSVGDVLEEGIMAKMLGAEERAKGWYAAAEKLGKKENPVDKFARKAEETRKRAVERLNASKEALQITPENLYVAVQTALSLTKNPPLVETTLPASASGRPPVTRNVYEIRANSRPWTLYLNRLADPVTKAQRPITFDPEIARDRDDVVLEGVNTPFTRAALQVLREQLWSEGETKQLHRVAFRTSDAIEEPTILVFSRFLATGGDARKLHEELLLTGMALTQNATSTRRLESKRSMEELYKNSEPLDNPPASLFERMKKLYRNAATLEKLRKTVEARAQERRLSLDGVLETQKNEEIARATELLDELEKALQEKLNPSRPEQRYFAGLGPDDELSRDPQYRNALKERLARIPWEREKEEQAIEERYAPEKIQHRSFPAAVFFIIPRSTVEAALSAQEEEER